MNFCLDDGNALVYGAEDEPVTNLLPRALESGSVPTEILTRAVPENGEKSIAVLPFTNIGGDIENEYFCDGLAEELLNALAKLDGLKVAARTSAFSFKNSNSKVGDIGLALNVRNVLEGSVRRAGDRIRIAIQLIDVANGYHLWSERYDREMKDIFSVQDEITLAVIGALKVKLFADETQPSLKRGTENIEAYETYLRGLFYRNKFGAGNLRKAIEYFEQAIKMDPNYALAHALLATSYRLLVANGVLEPKEFTSKAEHLTTKALELDPYLADAHGALALLRQDAWKWPEAEREYQTAIGLSPNLPWLRVSYGLLLAILGHPDEAVAQAKLSRELDPLSLRSNLAVGWILSTAYRFDEAIEALRRTLELNQDFAPAYNHLAYCYAAQGIYGEAVANYQKAISLDPDGRSNYLYLAAAYVGAGDREKADTTFNDVTARGEYIAPSELAIYYIAIGDLDKAFELLETAFTERDLNLQFLGYDLAYAPLRSAPRFIDLKRRVGLPN